MEQAIDRFTQACHPECGLFFFAGHSVQIDGESSRADCGAFSAASEVRDTPSRHAPALIAENALNVSRRSSMPDGTIPWGIASRDIQPGYGMGRPQARYCLCDESRQYSERYHRAQFPVHQLYVAGTHGCTAQHYLGAHSGAGEHPETHQG